MEKEMRIPVRYRFDNSDESEYNYYIVEEKSDENLVKIESGSLASNFGGSNTYHKSKFLNFPFGNYDVVLEQTNKNNDDFIKCFFAHLDDIKKI